MGSEVPINPIKPPPNRQNPINLIGNNRNRDMTKATGAPRGRPTASKNKRTVERELVTKGVVDKFKQAAELNKSLTLEQIEAMSPLDIMRHAMLLAAMDQKWNDAASLAKEIAPYIFAKLTSTKVDATVSRRTVKQLSDDELIALIGTEGDGTGQD